MTTLETPRPADLTSVSAPPRYPGEPATTTFGAFETGDGVIDFVAIQKSPEFQDIRRRYRRVAFFGTAGFMSWFMVYVLLSAYAHEFISTKVVGEINLGFVLGLAQFVTTVMIMLWYCWYADRRLEPLIDALARREGVDR